MQLVQSNNATRGPSEVVSRYLEAIYYMWSDIVERRLYEVLGRPATCPHGNPIPGYSEASPREMRVSSLPSGARAAITRVSEVAEREAPLLLAYLDQRDLTPGREVSILEVDDVGRTLRVRVADKDVTLSHETASKIWAVSLAKEQPQGH